MKTIFVFALIGFLLMIGEIFIPGTVLATLGLIALCIAVWKGYATYGFITGTWILAVIGILYSIGLLIWMKVFPHTTMGMRISNRTSVSPSLIEKSQLIGAQGIALSMLRPAGIALINGQRRDVVTDGSFVESNTPIEVISEEGQKLVVRALHSNESDESKFSPL
jgi:membrane-bound ClpP family serine protease